MLRDSVAVVVRTRPRAIPLAIITMRKSTHGFPFLSHDEHGAPLGGSSGCRSSAINANDAFSMHRNSSLIDSLSLSAKALRTHQKRFNFA